MYWSLLKSWTPLEEGIKPNTICKHSISNDITLVAKLNMVPDLFYLLGLTRNHGAQSEEGTKPNTISKQCNANAITMIAQSSITPALFTFIGANSKS